MYRSPIYGGDNWNYNRYLVSKEKKADERIQNYSQTSDTDNRQFW